MVRPHKCRFVETEPGVVYFKPRGIPLPVLEEVVLAVEEREALRLADGEGLDQEPAAARMGVSRQTFGRILEKARRTVADAIVNGKAIRIEGGPIRIKKQFIGYGCLDCMNEWEDSKAIESDTIFEICPKCQSKKSYFLKKDLILKNT